MKLVIVAVALSLGLLGIQSIDVDARYQAIGLLAGVAYGLSAWALFGDLKKTEWLTVLILPVLYPVAVALFYFLLPVRLLSRILILSIFGIGMYALLLTENIFSVAAIRTIQLLRAAHAVGFLLTLLVAFFLWDTLFSFRLAPWWNALGVGITSLPLILQGLWSVNLEDKISQEVVNNSLGLSWGLTSLALMISFWPVTITIASLFLVTALYVGLGLVQNRMTGRLFKKTVTEYLWVSGLVVGLTFLLAQWK
ncbi:MAG: hypothetical protein UV54_C0044G0020 [Candidatus Beckwithbacteria bacterium GW2011_GWA2_43_10]|uniref:Uncharacterized protein n=1 Tax=Candidatus Beckwithbacteria bacterium GW2011_GWA2_43_10 TaxID=1618369 RepID=A0A0G1E7K7_9BACT|nr:MAG: hypothetical protein UV54_C0044G0020 [Candidatus Beckwithbacteria bacterium GW2011_GWA2_43_10]